MNLILKTAPATEPLTLQEVKDYLRIDADCGANEDTYLTALIKAARIFCENYQNRAYITQTWEMYLDYWDELEASIIEVPKGNLQSVTSITYKDSTGTVTTISNTDYIVSTKRLTGLIIPAYGKTWVTFTPYPIDAITVTFVCGYGSNASDVPEIVKIAMRLLISHWYEQRSPVQVGMSVSSEIEFTVSALLWQDRILSV